MRQSVNDEKFAGNYQLIIDSMRSSTLFMSYCLLIDNRKGLRGERKDSAENNLIETSKFN